MRLIDADALRARMYHDAFEIDSDFQKWESGCWIRYKMFENAIDDAPTIEPKRGENLNNKYMDCDQFICSECGIELRDWTRVEVDEDDGEEYHYEYVFRFCPNCGARMKGAENNKECHKPESLYYRAFCEERKDSAYCDGCEFWY